MSEPRFSHGERTPEQRERMQRKYDRARFDNLFGIDALPTVVSSPTPPTQATRKST